MNYLAHCFLSGENNEILFGNFVADGLKRSKTTDFSNLIMKGIDLHRFIDHFTDSHTLVKECVAILRSHQGKFSPVVVDMVFDHFLANHWHLYSLERLESYTQETYARLSGFLPLMPPNVVRMFDHMQRHNWLLSYKEESGMLQAFSGLSRRTRFPSSMHLAWDEIQLHYSPLEACFLAFFPELQKATTEYLWELISD